MLQEHEINRELRIGYHAALFGDVGGEKTGRLDGAFAGIGGYSAQEIGPVLHVKLFGAGNVSDTDDTYIYEDEVQPLLPKGTVLMFHSQFDNTASNPINPDPDQWVLFGARGVDEMSHGWVGMTPLTQEEYERLAAQRGILISEDGGP